MKAKFGGYNIVKARSSLISCSKTFSMRNEKCVSISTCGFLTTLEKCDCTFYCIYVKGPWHVTCFSIPPVYNIRLGFSLVLQKTVGHISTYTYSTQDTSSRVFGLNCEWKLQFHKDLEFFRWGKESSLSWSHNTLVIQPRFTKKADNLARQLTNTLTGSQFAE